MKKLILAVIFLFNFIGMKSQVKEINYLKISSQLISIGEDLDNNEIIDDSEVIKDKSIVNLKFDRGILNLSINDKQVVINECLTVYEVNGKYVQGVIGFFRDHKILEITFDEKKEKCHLRLFSEAKLQII